MNTYIDINALLKKEREIKGFTQKQVAEKLGIKLAAYNSFETGRSPIPENRKDEIIEILKSSALYFAFGRLKSKKKDKADINDHHMNNFSFLDFSQVVDHQATKYIMLNARTYEKGSEEEQIKFVENLAELSDTIGDIVRTLLSAYQQLSIPLEHVKKANEEIEEKTIEENPTPQI